MRKEARGRGCMVRIPEVCNCNSETVVLAHMRIASISGIRLKAPDLLGACH